MPLSTRASELTSEPRGLARPCGLIWKTSSFLACALACGATNLPVGATNTETELEATAGGANLVACTQPCDAPRGHVLWAVLILLSLRVWQTFGSHCTRMSQSCVLQRAFDLSRAPLCGARLGNSSAAKACARQLACVSLCYSPAPLALRHYSFDIGGVASADQRALRQSHWAGVYRGAVAWY